LRDHGYTVAVVEHYNAFAHVRQDLFGCIDIVAIAPNIPGVLGVQTTTASNLSARITKATTIPAIRIWLQAGNPFLFHGWKKVENRWKVRIVQICYRGDGFTIVEKGDLL
jgi:hypothetical protein